MPAKVEKKIKTKTVCAGCGSSRFQASGECVTCGRMKGRPAPAKPVRPGQKAAPSS